MLTLGVKPHLSSALHSPALGAIKPGNGAQQRGFAAVELYVIDPLFAIA